MQEPTRPNYTHRWRDLDVIQQLFELPDRVLEVLETAGAGAPNPSARAEKTKDWAASRIAAAAAGGARSVRTSSVGADRSGGDPGGPGGRLRPSSSASIDRPPSAAPPTAPSSATGNTCASASPPR